MSRGLGKLQRDIIAYLERTKAGTVATNLAYLYANDCWVDDPERGSPNKTTRSHLVAVRRAIHNLAERGLVVTTNGRMSHLSDGGKALGVRLPSQGWPKYFHPRS